jgi:hypothetical protein
MADKKDIDTGHIKDTGSVRVSVLFSSTLTEPLNTMQSRRSPLRFILGRFGRFLRSPVVLWFAGVIFVLLAVIMLMILLLNINVTGVDDLLAGIPLNTTGVRDISR